MSFATTTRHVTQQHIQGIYTPVLLSMSARAASMCLCCCADECVSFDRRMILLLYIIIIILHDHHPFSTRYHMMALWGALQL